MATSSCSNKDQEILAAFSVYCEMVANQAKPIALSQPLPGVTVDNLWSAFEEIAEKHQVHLHREDDFPTTLLFPSELTDGKSVVVIHKGIALTQYLQFLEDLEASETGGFASQENLARRFGRLLGYSTQGINDLLSKNAHYRTLASFGVSKQVTHLYYKDSSRAIKFYEKTLGLKKVGKAGFQISTDAFIEVHPTDQLHPKEQPKSTAIALLTDQLPEWYSYVMAEGIPVKYPYKPKVGGPHDGFVAIDPGGYLLEFETFKQHPENEAFMALLSQAPPITTNVDSLNFYGAITWTYHRDLLKMQKFYEEVLGFQKLADQGWTKIYQTSPNGFIGLVDERRGMHDYAETKAVEIEWKIKDNMGLDDYAGQFWGAYGYHNNTFTGPEEYNFRIKGVE